MIARIHMLATGEHDHTYRNRRCAVSQAIENTFNAAVRKRTLLVAATRADAGRSPLVSLRELMVLEMPDRWRTWRSHP